MRVNGKEEVDQMVAGIISVIQNKEINRNMCATAVMTLTEYA